jgi:Sensors of blue-light using FAD
MAAPTADAGDTAALFTLLYVSELARPEGELVAAICRQSRINNERDGITGLLVFDGLAFCQFVEGPEASITALSDRLERDPRHVKMDVLQSGRTPHARRFPDWRLGYAFSADPAAIERLRSARDREALAAFDRLLPSWSSDVDPSLSAG